MIKWFVMILLLLFLLAVTVIVYPLRRHKYVANLLAIFAVISVLTAYWQWGHWQEWYQYIQKTQRQEQVQALLKSFNNTQQLIEKLKQKLDDNPESARGWYLLGRLYASQHDWQNARDAFVSSLQVDEAYEPAAINYAQSLWQLNGHHFDDTIRRVLHSVLRHNSEQPEALAMLAMEAYNRHDYSQAINYWQKLLILLPKHSEQAQSIRKAIIKAQTENKSDNIEKESNNG